MNAATRTKRVKATLRAAGIEILACATEQPEWTRVRVYNKVAAAARDALTQGGLFERIEDAGSGPSTTELNVWA